MKTILAIDPGPVESACIYAELWPEGLKLLQHGKFQNEQLERMVSCSIEGPNAQIVGVIEMPGSAGLVGREVFETCYWVGRFALRFEQGFHYKNPCNRMYRSDVAKEFGVASKSRDSVLRARLIDIYGGVEGKAKAIGKKKTPGPLYGLKGDCWQALALAFAFAQRERLIAPF